MLVCPSIPSTTAFGSHIHNADGNLYLASILSSAAFGDHTLIQHFDVASIPATAAFGSHALRYIVTRSIQTSWSVWVSQGVSAAFDYLPVEITFDQALPLTLDASLSKGQSLYLDNLLPLAINADLSVSSQSVTMDRSLALTLSAEAIKPRSIQADLFLTFDMEMQAEKAAAMTSDQSLPLTLEAYISLAPRFGQLVASYRILFPVQSHLSARYASADLSDASLVASWSLAVGRSLTAKHDIGTMAIQGLSTPWSMAIVDASLAAHSGAPTHSSLTAPIHYSVARGLESRFAVMGPVAGDLTVTWSETVGVTGEIQAAFDMLALNPVKGCIATYWDLLAVQPPIQASPGLRVIHFGVPL